MKQSLPPVAVKIALNMQSGRAEKLRKRGSVLSGARVEEGKGRRRGARVHEEGEKMRNECRALAVEGPHDFSFPRRAVKIARVQPLRPPAHPSRPRTLCSRQTRGRITAIIIRLMPCKLSGRERPFAWFYAHFSADA